MSGRPKNTDVRPREYLTVDEVWTLVQAARRRKNGRNNSRDAAFIEITYRHGLRCSEAILLTWDDISLTHRTMKVRRLKGGVSNTHMLLPEEIKTLKTLQRKCPHSHYLFTAEGGGPIDRRTAFDIVAKAGKAAGFAFPVHPHMLRHAKGKNLVNRSKDIRLIAAYLGHKSIQSSMIYTIPDEAAFNGLSGDRG